CCSIASGWPIDLPSVHRALFAPCDEALLARQPCHALVERVARYLSVRILKSVRDAVAARSFQLGELFRHVLCCVGDASFLVEQRLDPLLVAPDLAPKELLQHSPIDVAAPCEYVKVHMSFALHLPAGEAFYLVVRVCPIPP